MKTCFSEGKLMKEFGNPPLSETTPLPFQLIPLFLRNFFHDPPPCGNFQNKKPPLILGGRKLFNIYSVRFLTSNLWALLPQNIKSCKSLQEFKRLIKV